MERSAGDQEVANVKTLVLDASVIVKWFNQEEHTDKALRAKELYQRGRLELVEPELVRYELGNSLRYNPSFGVEDVRIALFALEKLQLAMRPLSGELARRTVDAAYLYGLTLYDSSYVALAEMVESILYTADAEVVAKVSKPYVKYVTELP